MAGGSVMDGGRGGGGRLEPCGFRCGTSFEGKGRGLGNGRGLGKEGMCVSRLMENNFHVMKGDGKVGRGGGGGGERKGMEGEGDREG